MKFFKSLKMLYRYVKANIICGYLDSIPNNLKVNAIRNRGDLERVCRFLYEQYRCRNLCPENTFSMHYSPHMFLKNSRTFVLRQHCMLLGTMSVFPDSAAGIPCEILYPKEIDHLRKQGIRFAEVGLLATDLNKITIHGYSLTSAQKMLPVFSLFKIMTNYVLAKGLTHLVITVHPKHANLYKFFGFEQFAEVKNYESVCGKPAVPMIFDLEASTRTGARLQRKYFYNNLFTKVDFDNQLSEDPNAFALVFGESFLSFDERYNHDSEELEKFDRGNPQEAYIPSL